MLLIPLARLDAATPSSCRVIPNSIPYHGQKMSCCRVILNLIQDLCHETDPSRKHNLDAKSSLA